MQKNYNKIEQEIIKALWEAKIRAELSEKSHGFSYDLMRFLILSSPRISQSRLDGISEALSEELGYPVKLWKEAEYINAEFPSLSPREVYFENVAESLKKSRCILPIALGRKDNGHKAIIDLHCMPHLLIGGSGDSGQLDLLKNVITSITEKRTEEEVRFILADIEGNDLDNYSDSPYLQHNAVVKDKESLFESLEWLNDEIMRRYCLFAEAEVKNIVEYNRKADEKLPYLVLIVKDLKNVMMNYGQDLEIYLQKIAAKAMAPGVHIALSSTAVSSAIITVGILNSMPARAAFQTDNAIQSRILINMPDAMYLYYPGDFLFQRKYGEEPLRMKLYS